MWGLLLKIIYKEEFSILLVWNSCPSTQNEPLCSVLLYQINILSDIYLLGIQEQKRKSSIAYYSLLHNHRSTEEQSREGSQKALWFMPLPSQVQLIIVSKPFLGDVFLTFP